MTGGIELYEQIAENIAGKFRLEIQLKKITDPESYNFDKLMTIVMNMEQELTAKGITLIDAFKKTDADTEKLTDEVQNTIRKTIETFIKTL